MPNVLERGRVYFFYRPRVQLEEARGLDEVQRFQLVLSPDDRPVWRLLTIGRKRLPEIDDGGERFWGWVDLVAEAPEAIAGELDRQVYGTKTRGVRVQAEARPAGQGRYAIASHEEHTHLAYVLELPHDRGPVQEDLRIEPRADYIVVQLEHQAAGARRFVQLFPDALDHGGAELVLIGATREPERDLGIELAPDDEAATEAALFTDLGIEGRWH
jgi:hypothetical protein